MRQIEASAAAEMSREEALRVLATAEGVSESEKRVATLMLAGPELTLTDESRLRRLRLRRAPVARALLELGKDLKDERLAANDDLRVLGGRR